MTANSLLTVNAGSSSLRCSVFDRTLDGPKPRLHLSLRGLPTRMIWERQDVQADKTEETELDPPKDAATAQDRARDVMIQHLIDEVDADDIAAVSHRVVHGGPHYSDPVKIDSTVIDDLDALVPLAPSHQPHNLGAIRDLADRFPDIPQIACFDTAFHRTLPRNDRIFALPKHLMDEGIVRYGFHGLSYEHIAMALADTAPALAKGRVVVLHLGHGVSMCALKNGQSIATTMGMTPLDGVPMGRRPGALDPGILLYLIEEKGIAPSDLRDMLFNRSGLLGLSDLSSEMDDLLESDGHDAKCAVDFFVYRCHREIGSLAAALGGIDGIVLTGGMGEHAPEIRKRICTGLDWLGVAFDEDSNRKGATRLSPEDARVPVLLIPTDEEMVLARHAEHLLRTEASLAG